MKTVAFLLGAGCEGKGQLGLCSGNTFKRDTILANNVTEFIYSINVKTGPEIKNSPFIAYNSYSSLYQTIAEYDVKAFNLDDKNDEIILSSYLDIKMDSKSAKYSDDEKKEIREKFKNFYYDKIYRLIKDIRSSTDSLPEYVKFYLDHACFYSSVDSLFNYLRKPDIYKKEVNRLIKLYYSAYLSVISGFISDKDKDKIIHGSSIIDNRSLLEDVVNKAQDEIIESNTNNDKLYYNIIKNFNVVSGFDVCAITTNYTDFAKRFIDLPDNKFAQVHGSLNLFEDIKSKRTDIISNFSESDVIFPFIFVQSGVKPIVNGYQIHEFEKAWKMIIESDYLIIIGYGVNSDDEHISNLLRERLENKEIIYVLHNNTPDNQNEILNVLLYKDKIRFISTTEFQDTLNHIKSE